MRFLDLGVLRIEVDGAVLSPGGPRPAAVLSSLLLHLNERVTTDLLLDAAWAGQPPHRAEEALHTHIWRLRRALEPERPQRGPAMIRREGHGYRLDADVEHVDSAHFEQLGSLANERLVDERPDRALVLIGDALRLWRGPPFVHLSERPWAMPAIARLDRLYLQLQERRISALVHCGEHDQAITDGDLLLQAHPLRERLWGQLMVACYRTGRIDEALATFQRARRALRTEAALEPGPDLVRIHQQILRRDPALDSHRRASISLVDAATGLLPRQRHLIARSHELASLDQLLDDAQLVSVVGPAGCGKTVLALEAARAASVRLGDAVWFVDLSAMDTNTAGSAVIEHVANILGLTRSTHGGHAASLQTFARSHRGLIVLDNCEHLISQTAQICDAILTAGARTQILTTSREPIGRPGEQIFHLRPLSTDGTPTSPRPHRPQHCSCTTTNAGDPKPTSPTMNGTQSYVCAGPSTGYPLPSSSPPDGPPPTPSPRSPTKPKTTQDL